MKKIYKCCVLVPILATTVHANTFSDTREKKCTECGLCEGGKSNKTAEYYEVKKNDTLGDIAKKLGIGVDKIIGLNDIKNPNLIYPGTKLKIYEARKNHKIYTVRKNDTLGDIAKKTGVNIEKIIELNGITNPDLIYPGMGLCIEDLSKEFTIYKVKKNDTLGKIAKKLEVNLEEIIELNEIKDSNKIFPGQELKIPTYSKVIKVETTTQSYVEISQNEEVIAHQATYDDEIVNIENENLQTGDKVSLKVYDNEGQIEEKELEISKGKVTFISFIDNNKNGFLDIEDTLITDGTLEINKDVIGISPLGKTEISNVELGETYNISINSAENNLEVRDMPIKITEEKMFIPIKNEFFTLKGNIKLIGKSLFTKKREVYDNLLLRIRNSKGEEILFLPIDKMGNFYIDRIVKGDYFYDVEEITNSKLITLEKNKKFTVKDNNELELELKLKNKLF